MFVTDADNREVLEYDGTSSAVQRWYAFGLGPDAVLNQMNVASGTRATMVPDIQGSIVATLNSVTGTLTKTGYQPYGENPASLGGTFRYTGRRLDPETGGSAAQPSGLYYYRARTYSPTLGRFLQPDPIGYAGGNNLYAYVSNDPLNLVDPLGLCDNPQGCGGSNNQILPGSVTAENLPTVTTGLRTPTALDRCRPCLGAAPDRRNDLCLRSELQTACGLVGARQSGLGAPVPRRRWRHHRQRLGREPWSPEHPQDLVTYSTNLTVPSNSA